MNKTIVNFTREQIKKGLSQLPEKNQLFFKRLYSHKDLEKSIDKVVDNMPEEKLNWALTQIENTLKKRTQGD